MTEKIFRSEQTLSRSEIAKHLRSIADGVEEGNISLKSGNNSLALQPSENSELEIEIEWNEERESGELEIG